MRFSSSRKTRLLCGLALVALVMLTGACAENAPQDVLRPAGPRADEADKLWDIVFAVAVVIFFIVEGLLVFAVIKFRHRPGRVASQFHGNTKLEIVLTVIPALILAAIAVPTVSTIMAQAEVPDGAMEVKVIAHQFWWEYQYEEEGVVTANEMHIPVGTPVHITLEGATTDGVDSTAEAIHSFWVPRLGGAQDIVPGRVTDLTIEAGEPGTFLGQCKEFCGLGHAYMRLVVIAESDADFQSWVSDLQSGATPSSEVEEGRDLFENGAENGGFAQGPACAACHAVDATQPAPNIGPNLGGFSVRETFAGATLTNNRENLAAWLAGPADVKDGAKMPDLGLEQEQIDALIAYLESL